MVKLQGLMGLKSKNIISIKITVFVIMMSVWPVRASDPSGEFDDGGLTPADAMEVTPDAAPAGESAPVADQAVTSGAALSDESAPVWEPEDVTAVDQAGESASITDVNIPDIIDTGAGATVAADVNTPVDAVNASETNESGSGSIWRNFTYSARADFAYIVSEITTIAIDAEAGRISDKGFFSTVNGTIGLNYFGGGVNAGYFYEIKNGMKGAVGGTAGHYRARWDVKLVSEDGSVVLSREKASGRSYGGAFWKFYFGYFDNNSNHKIDVTLRALFGNKFNSVVFDHDKGEVLRSDKIGMVFSGGVGYALVRRRDR